MDLFWIKTTPESVVGVLVSTVAIYLAVIVFTRISGLRSFAKMSSFDFAMTVAVGSLIATTITMKNPPLLQSIIALAALYILQMGVARLRIRGSLKGLVDNRPLLLMKESKMLEDNMKKASLTRDDMRNKLREANVTQLSQVKAVVMETTGDISVLQHEDPNHRLDIELLKNVRGADKKMISADFK